MDSIQANGFNFDPSPPPLPLLPWHLVRSEGERGGGEGEVSNSLSYSLKWGCMSVMFCIVDIPLPLLPPADPLTLPLPSPSPPPDFQIQFSQHFWHLPLLPPELTEGSPEGTRGPNGRITPRRGGIAIRSI